MSSRLFLDHACQSFEWALTERARFVHWLFRLEGALICHCQRSACPFEKPSRISATVQPCLASASPIYRAPLCLPSAGRRCWVPCPTAAAGAFLACIVDSAHLAWRFGPACDQLRWAQVTQLQQRQALELQILSGCARITGCAPYAALASATSPSQSLSPKHTLALASHTPACHPQLLRADDCADDDPAHLTTAVSAPTSPLPRRGLITASSSLRECA